MNDPIDHGTYVVPPVITSRFHAEETAPGVELNNYTKRTPSEDGTYVMVVTHTERIEKIKQPPTPEEIAERKRQDKIMGMILGGMALAFFGFIGTMVYIDEKTRQREEDQKQLERIRRTNERVGEMIESDS